MGLDERNSALDKQIEATPNLENGLAHVIKYGHQNRRLINWVIVSLTLDIILTVILTGVFMRQQHNQNTILDNHNAIVYSCTATNESKKGNLVLWQYVLALPPASPRTPTQQTAIDDFSALVT